MAQDRAATEAGLGQKDDPAITWPVASRVKLPGDT